MHGAAACFPRYSFSTMDTTGASVLILALQIVLQKPFPIKQVT